MKRSGKSKHTARNIALAALLAVLCIGAAELTFCRYFAPEIYERVVAPVRHAAAVTADAGRAGLDAAGRFIRGVGRTAVNFTVWTREQTTALWEDFTAPKETPEPNPPEVSGEPAASFDPTASPTPVPITQLLEVDGRQILTGGSVDVTYFCQTDGEWADQPFGTDTIGLYGCGPTAMAIAVASLTDTQTDPAVMAAWAADNGYWARRSGSYHSIVLGTAQGFGLLAESFTSRDTDDMLDALSQGKIMVALMGPGHFTDGGHFIVLRGVTQDGQVLVADPNSRENSLIAWDPQLILDELSSSQSHGAPLWALWTPASAAVSPQGKSARY